MFMSHLMSKGVRTMKKINVLVGLMISLLFVQGLAFASADLKGMGDGSGPAATGDNGIEWNPAAMSPDYSFVMDLTFLETRFWTDSLSVLEILEYGGFVEGGNNQWTTEDVEDILNSIPDSGFSIYLDHTTRPKMIIGPVGISAGITGQVRGTVDKDIFNFLLKGNKEYVDLTGEDKAEKLLNLTDTQVDVLATADTAVTLSFPIKKWFEKTLSYFDDFYAGTSIHVATGVYGNLSLTDETAFYISYSEPNEDGLQIPTIRFDDQEDIQQKLDEMEDGEMYPLIRAIYTVNPDEPRDLSYFGKGVAFDFGVYAKKDNFSYGLSFMNMGSINFSKYRIVEYGIIKDSTQDWDFRLADELAFRDVENSLKVPLPFRVNLGTSYQWGRWLKAGAHISGVRTVSVNLNDADQLEYIGHGHLEYGAGLELNPIWILPLRVGIIGSKNTVSLTGGFGLHLGPVKTDVGVVTSYKDLSVNLNTALEF